MKSLEEVIKYKLNFLPKGTDPFYTIQTHKFDDTENYINLYETKIPIFSTDSLSLVEDITPLFIYISSCDKYYRENGYGKIKMINISLDMPNSEVLVRGALYDEYRTICHYINTFHNTFDDLEEENRIAIFKKRLNESFLRMGFCIRYIEPFNLQIPIMFIKFNVSVNKYKIFKAEECVTCLEEEPKVLFCDCGHLCICKKCFVCRFGNCPVCRKKTTILRIIE